MINAFYLIFKKLYKMNKIGRFIVKIYINKFEKGEFCSSTLRKIYSDLYNMKIGIGTYGCFSPDFNFGSPAIIGRYCSIAAEVKSIPGNHPIGDVSTHPFFHITSFGYCKSVRGVNITVLYT